MSHAPRDITTAWLTWVKKEGLMDKFAVLIFIIIIFHPIKVCKLERFEEVLNCTVHLIVIAHFVSGRLSDVVVSYLGFPKPGGGKTQLLVTR